MEWKLAFKDSWEQSKKSFDSSTGKLAYISGLVAGLVLTHSIKEDWGNRMIWWSLAIPPLVFVVIFIWKLIGHFHKGHPDKTPHFATFLISATIALFVTFMVERSEIKNLRVERDNQKSEITSLQKQLADIGNSNENKRPSDNEVILTAPGISEPIMEKQQLRASFAGMTFSVFQIGSNIPMATITTTPHDGDSQQSADFVGNPFFTNYFNGNYYVATLESVICTDPRSIKIKVLQK